MEREKRDAQRQMHRLLPDCSQVECSKDYVDLINQKIRILERDQQPEVDHHRQGHDAPGRAALGDALHPRSQRVVHGDDAQHDQNVAPLAPDVEQQARHQQKEIAEAQGDQEIECQDDWQIEEQEERRAEQHRRTPEGRS